MKTLTKDSLSLYLFGDDEVITMLADSVVTPQATICDCNSSNSILHTNATAPEGWAGTKFSFDGTTWSRNPDFMAQQANEAKEKRNKLLQESDWTQVADAPVNKTAWAAYRQELRDVPQQAGFPDAILWPNAPEA